jgi:hypothetical protein
MPNTNVRSVYLGLSPSFVSSGGQAGKTVWVPATSGRRYYVQSTATNASDGNTGLDAGFPLATIDGGVNKCTASQGDQVIALPGHTETISAAAGVGMDTAGVGIYGMGEYDARPTLTFSAVAADINVSAENCVISNLKLSSSVNSLENFVDADAGNLRVEACHFVTGSATEALNFINLATTKDNFFINGNRFEQPVDPAGTDTAANTGAIYLVDTEDVWIENNTFIGNFETAVVHNKSTKCQHLYFNHNTVYQELGTSEVFLLVAASEGMADHNIVQVPAATDVAVANIWGTVGILFFLGVNNSCSNDSGGGGQLAVPGATAAS